MKSFPIKKMQLAFLLVCLNTFTQSISQTHVYNYKGEVVYLLKDTTERMMYLSKELDSSTVLHVINKTKTVCGEQNVEAFSPHTLRIQATEEQVNQLAVVFENDTTVVSISETYQTEHNSHVWCTNKIIVKPKEQMSIISILQREGIPYKEIVCLDTIDNIFLVTLSGFLDKSIEYANSLFELDDVISTRPNLGYYLKKHINLNPFYGDQWGLENTGQYGGVNGIDIHAQTAWNYSTGYKTRVAILDDGVELDHPDLFANMLLGYDATQGAVLGDNGDCRDGDFHGTGCAGIIAASNNQIGVIGVAYDAQIIPIRIYYDVLWGGYTTDAWIIDGIQKAWQNYDADVLSCSWSLDLEESLQDYINLSISNAIHYGRGGNGCVVVFSAGNENDSVSYLCNSNPEIITAGAISPCGERKTPVSCDGETWWGSNFGEGLDVVAPGVFVPTTDNQGTDGLNYVISSNDYSDLDYTYKFNGTSAAAPHVSGVAALILSINSDLTSSQVSRIIKGTSQKVGGYAYSFSPTKHLNNSWHNWVGHGLVDADAAVQVAYNEVRNLYIRDNVADNGDEPNQTSNAVNNSPDIWITDLSGNTVSGLEQGQSYRIKVRVYNKKNTPCTINDNSLTVKWTATTGALYWNSSFINPCPACQCAKQGSVTAPSNTRTIPANGSAIITLNWTAPGSPLCSYYCQTRLINLVAYFDDGGLTIGALETNCPLQHFVRANNNVAWKKYNLDYNLVIPPIIQSITPNPTGTQAEVVIDMRGCTDEVQLFVTNAYGNNIFSTSVTNTESKTIDVTSIPPGIYNVYLVLNETIVDSKILLKY